jgi:hypothetical protein
MSIPHARKPAREIEQAGGAYVRRRFTMGNRDLINGDILSAADLAVIRPANLTALINTGKLETFPAGPTAAGDSGRFAVHLGFGKYDVIEGHKITDEPVTKEEAEALVGAPASTEQ